jgi:putative copper export protein
VSAPSGAARTHRSSGDREPGLGARSTSLTLLAVLCTTVVCVTVATRPDLLRPAANAVDGPGALVDLAAAVARAVSLLGSVCCVGALLTAQVLLPRDRSAVCAENSGRLSRAASHWGFVWAVAAAAEVLLLAATVADQSVGHVLTVGPGAAAAFVASQVRTWAVAAWVGGLVALLATRARSTVVRAVLLLATVGGLLAPLLTGHGGGAGVPVAATLALAVHVLAVSCWVGGLVAVCLHVRGLQLAPTVATFSRLALVCSVLVGLSGIANVAVRLSWQETLHSGAYGALLAAKVSGIVVLVLVGRRHRRLTLPALGAGDARPLWRLAGVELVLMMAVMGLAVVLSGTGPTTG